MSRDFLIYSFLLTLTTQEVHLLTKRVKERIIIILQSNLSLTDFFKERERRRKRHPIDTGGHHLLLFQSANSELFSYLFFNHIW